MFYKIEDELIYTIIFNEKIERIFVDNPNDIEVGSILHARVKRVDKNRSFSFVEMGGYDGFYDNDDLKAGDDYLFNIRKKPGGEKGYVLDRNLKIEISNNIMYPLSEKYFNNDMEQIIGCPVKSKNFDKRVANELKIIFEKLKSEKSKLPIPKIIYQKNKISEDYILKHGEKLGKKEDLLKAFSNTPELTGRYVLLNDGSIIIDSLPHVTFVDFNSDNYSKVYNRELNHVELNKKLLDDATRILNLRNIEGMILIDLLKMKEYKEVINHAKNILKNTGFIYHDITALGIMEITRKKIGRTLIDEEIKNIIINHLIKS